MFPLLQTAYFLLLPSFPTRRSSDLTLEQPAEATFEHFLTDRTIEQLERYATDFHGTGRPFFMATHFFGPHLPYLLPRRSEEHTSELQSRGHLVCRLLLEKKTIRTLR